jgi:hypothetical protein
MCLLRVAQSVYEDTVHEATTSTCTSFPSLEIEALPVAEAARTFPSRPEQHGEISGPWPRESVGALTAPEGQTPEQREPRWP